MRLDSSYPHVTSQIASRLRSARLAAGLTMEQLGDRLGLTRSSIYRYERGQSSINAVCLWALASAIGVEPADLMPPRGDV